MFRRTFKIKTITALALAVSLLLSTPVLAAEDTLPEVKALLQNQYVDPVASEVLQAPSIEEMLQKLGDPHTIYFTAKQYQDFINSMDMTFSGIGVYIELAPAGIRITSVIEGSPAAEVGLKAGDLITEVAGQSLAGLPQETAVGFLRGLDGSSVQITVQRGGTTFNLAVPRRAIEIPTVDGKLINGEIGYIAIHTFGATTPAGFDQIVKELKGNGAKAWIIDLRDNPGGYLSSALSMAGYFIGDQTALQTKDRSGKYVPYPGVKQAVTLNEPTMFLTNENSASASEILTSVVKDYHKATIVGNRTYGKGSVQSMFPLTDGSVLKMTIAKFFSPFGNEINKVGINPDVKILSSDSEKVAELLLEGALQPVKTTSQTTIGEGKTSDPEGSVQVYANSKFWKISLEQARTPEFWQSYGELVSTLSPGNVQKWEGQSWLQFSDQEKVKRWPLFYPDYRELTGLQGVPLDKKFTVTFNSSMNWQTVTAESLEIIESESGERVMLEFTPLSDHELQVIPKDLLQSGKTYWLVTHPTIQGKDGVALADGALAVIQTVTSGSAPVKVQSSRPARPQGELLPLPDYGQALLDVNVNSLSK
ncbi:S41 family peptidase [Desulfitobacterium sp.]|uniref:S41 family peptidase n=1 Tax=Desulfitobacterium sp. TaxID=49981 RepID=UPI002BEC17D6|nr:S41 family peptidase [Desulfitobacterium sp.]HVJ49775.1 S41 family peptidase [Desulfitobacterium sp.]